MERLLLESLSYQLDDLSAPWAITEFDSVFMSLHVEDDKGIKPKVTGQYKEGSNNRTIKGRNIKGHRGIVVNQERLFARSLGQFFKKQSESKTLMGHVVFFDRLLDPNLDLNHVNNTENPIINTQDLGVIYPAFFGDNTNLNYGQAIEIYLLNILTRNIFPEIIGYPDPLHKADWGAKSVKKQVDRLIKSSEITFRSKPLARTIRTTRDTARRK